MAEVVVLGTVGIREGETVHAVRSEKQGLVLAHLALALGGPVSEHLLIDELWQKAPVGPVHALQAHVSRLRSATGLPITFTTGGYQLDPLQVTTDASRFEDVLRAAESSSLEPSSTIDAMREGLQLWRGDVLENLPMTPALLAHRARLDLLREQAVTRLVDAYVAAGEPESALPLLHDAVDLNPLNEHRWGQLMTALHRAGRRGEALATFARARETLVEQIGLEPSARLQRVHRTILSDDRPPRHTRTAPVDARPPSEVAGRDREWSALNRLWREAQEQQRVAVISGEAGIGKTYLASRFMAGLPTGSSHTGRCQVDREVPFEPVAQLIRSGCSGLPPPEVAQRFTADAAVLRSLVPDVLAGVDGPDPSGVAPDPQVERHRIQLGMVAWLRQTTAAAGPVCLLIDDLQWADPDSVQLLAALWSQTLTLPVLWLVTLRHHAPLHRGADAGLLEGATRPSEAVVHLPLEGLERAAIADLMRTARGDVEAGPPDDAALDDMLAATAGNPLFVLETTRHLATAGDAAAPLVAGSLPPSLTTIVESHLHRVPGAARELLELAAIIGEDFDPLLAGLAADQGPREVDEFLALGQHQRLLAPLEGNDRRFRFRHALVHAVVVQQIPPLRRAQLHLRVADAIGRHPHLTDRLHLLAHHHLQTVSLVGADAAITHLLAAADLSMEQRAPAVAHAHYQQARDLLAPTAPLSRRAQIHLGMGEAGFRAGLDHRADLLEAARLAHEAGDVERLVRAAVANSRGWYSSITGIDRERIAVIETALELLPERSDLWHAASRSRLLSLWAMENVRDPLRRKDALLRSEQSMQIAEDLDDPDLLGEIMCHRFSVLYATLADPLGAFEFAKRLDDFAHARIDPELQLNSAIAVAQSAMTVGDFATADPALVRSEHLAAALSHPPRMWLVRTWRATRIAMQGDLAAAEVVATEALEMGMESEQADAFAFFSGQLFAYYHLAGRLPELLEAVEGQVSTLDDQIPAWRAAYAMVLVSVGRHDDARAVVDSFHERRFADLPLDVLYLSAMCNLAEVVACLEHAEAAPDLYDALLPYRGMIATNATIDSGPVDLALGRLAQVMGAPERAGHHLGQAEAWCRRVDARLWLERVRAAMSGPSRTPASR